VCVAAGATPSDPVCIAAGEACATNGGTCCAGTVCAQVSGGVHACAPPP